MLVQDRASPKLSHHHQQQPDPSPRKSKLSMSRVSSCSASSLTRIVAAAVLLAAAAVVVILLPPGGDTTALLCFERSHTPAAAGIPYPQIAFSRIPPLPPTGPFASFRADRWIVVAAPPGAPSPSLRRLARIPTFQLLAVATSLTDANFTLKGAIFLSLEHQSLLGFRITGLLPYHTHVRKSLGYLFAIQHGARLIYDADHRADVLGSDLAHRFDLDLTGDVPIILQYSHADPNRTVVNPYVHFGQRTVWPRGLPLENVGEVAHEEFYTQIYGGQQYIQQGLSDGLPDVDAVFYFTRKSSALEVFDIRFDPDAPKVALPQGTMAPINSFNTLFHAQAFWGLMLPVSVSSMAADVIRGYWAQRILWEIGGFATFYPPTIHRFDRAEAYPFADEKDLHVNVGRLIKFLVSWRTKKITLFERILDLSYAMAEEGFWSEVDVRFTAAWLQDLVAIGCPQPRLMALELDRQRGTIGHGDRKEFVPKKLPSVHLGVEEVGTVSSEIGNLIRWRKNFGNVVLVMHCSGPVERTALEWRLLYGRIFKTVIIYSETNSTDLAVEYGQLSQAYKYLPKVFDRYKGAEGFLFLQDDMVLNYWNLLQADKTKLWITNKVPQSWFSVAIDANSSEWFVKQANLVKQVVDTFPVHLQVSYKESMGDKLPVCGSEIFYIPQRLVGDFVDLVRIVGDLDVHHKVAVPMFFMAMDSQQSFDSDALATIMYSKERFDKKSSSSITGYYRDNVPAVYPVNVRTETDFVKLIRVMASGDPLLVELV